MTLYSRGSYLPDSRTCGLSEHLLISQSDLVNSDECVLFQLFSTTVQDTYNESNDKHASLTFFYTNDLPTAVNGTLVTRGGSRTSAAVCPNISILIFQAVYLCVKVCFAVIKQCLLQVFCSLNECLIRRRETL